MSKAYVVLFTLLLSVLSALASSPGRIGYPGGKFYIYRLTLTDKRGSTGTLSAPEAFLSPRSLARRARQHIAVDSTDLPLSAVYLGKLKEQGAQVIGGSKWNNTVLVRTLDTLSVRPLRTLPFVRNAVQVFRAPDSTTVVPPQPIHDSVFTHHARGDKYGRGAIQIDMLDGRRLHQAGYRGKGMLIAVIDGGYMNVDKIAPHYHFNVVGQRDCVWPYDANVYHLLSHGTMVLSTMASNVDSVFIGTAPEASYLLLRSEDSRSEQRVEEDYWAQAAEYADSVGADVINSSLGYTNFDIEGSSIRYRDQNGKTELISRTASRLADKGMVLVCSAGNEGMKFWKRIGCPADALGILSVGALSDDSVNALFSSLGPSIDGRVKPEVAALGLGATVVNGSGKISEANGTSFASPILCGLVACLWQAMPQKTAHDIVDIVCRSANRYDHPDNIFGYGIPDFYRALAPKPTHAQPTRQ